MLKRFLSKTYVAFLLGVAFNFSPFFSYAQDETSTVVAAQDETGTEEASQDGISTDVAVIAQGKQLFNGNCKACHNMDTRLVGPALADVYNRAPSIDWIKEFIKNPSKVVGSGDSYATDLFDEYGVMMTGFPLEDDQIMSILAYVKDQTENAPAEVVAAEVDPNVPVAAEGPSEYLVYVMVGLVIVLFLILAVLTLILGVMKRYLYQQDEISEEDRELVDQGFSLSSFVRSKPVILLVTFVLTAFIAKGVINGLYSIGIQKGYAPTQPIAYSHAKHAGEFGIDCNYCHTGVRKSRSANLPSANICMNCHSTILADSEEVQKIYAAVENNQPIEWVRIHNLPDLAFFNHQQHVVVGEVECQTCHGPIEEMEVVAQDQLLTMGWCVNCHRTTEVKSSNNEYYEKLLEYHNGESMTVEDIGGLECAKCHY